MTTSTKTPPVHRNGNGKASNSLPPKATTYTTGQIGRLLGVAPRTVSLWIDKGQLPGYRIPGSQDRRVTEEDLVRFARQNQIPVKLLTGACGPVVRVLAIGLPAALAAALGQALPLAWSLEAAAGVFAAGAAYWREKPAVIVLGATLGRAACVEAATLLLRDRLPPVIVALRPEDQPPGWLDLANVIELPAAGLDGATLAESLGKVGIGGRS